MTGPSWARVVGVAAGAALFSLPVAGCGSGGSEEGSAEKAAESKAAESDDRPADRGVCTAEAKALERPYGDDFPEDFPFPPRTVVYDFEDRGESGVIVTAVSATAFPDILDFMNNEVVDAGFEVTSGETEEHDAEANWSSGEQKGRWAIRESGQCSGETVLQVLAGPG